MYEIRQYLTAEGKNLFGTWLRGLADKRAVARIVARTDRMSRGNFGDHKSVGDGVWELRVDYGPGYRVYYAMAGREVVLLLCGGNKKKQSADIQTAIFLWEDFERRRKLP